MIDLTYGIEHQPGVTFLLDVEEAHLARLQVDELNQDVFNILATDRSKEFDVCGSFLLRHVVLLGLCVLRYCALDFKYSSRRCAPSWFVT
ncbi:hypothetical protein D3C86_1995930 [compost metagenome]